MDQKRTENNSIIRGKFHVTVNPQETEDGANLHVMFDLLLATLMAFQMLMILFVVSEMMGNFKDAPGYESPLHELCPVDLLAKREVKGIGMELFLLICSIQFMGTAILFMKRFKMYRGKPKPKKLVGSLFLFKVTNNLYDRLAKKLRELKKTISAADNQAKGELLKNKP